MYSSPARIIPIIFGLTALCASTQGFAQSNPANPANKPIVKVTGPDGKVTYTDRNLMAPAGAKVVEIRRGVASNNTLAATPEQTKAEKAAAKSDLVTWAQQQQAAVDAQQKAIDEANATIAKNTCDQARQHLSILARGRVARPNAKGEAEYLTDAQVAGERASATEQIAKYCK